jgi:uroporphyrinogen-III synthase
VLFAAAEGASRRPIEELGADFDPLYRTHALRPSAPPEGDLVVLASGSAARSFAELDTDIPAVSIGPQTTQSAEAAGLRVVAEAKTHDLDGLIAAIGALPSS